MIANRSASESDRDGDVGLADYGDIELRATIHRARVLYSYGWTHLDTGSPRALLSVVESLEPSSFASFFLTKGDGPLVTALRARGAEIVRGDAGSVSPWRPRSAVIAIRRQLRLLESLRIDLVHLNEAGWNFDLVLAAALRRIRVVLHVHNPATVHRRNLDWMLADRIVFVSKAQRASTEHLELIRDKATVIYNAVDVERFARGTSLRQTLGLAAGDFVVGVISQLSHRKGIDLVLDAAASLIPRYPNLVFLIAGPAATGEQDYGNAMKLRAADPGFDGRVRFLGPRSDIPDVLASCDLFCHPARAEPLGIAIMEAMAASLPVVASNVGGIPEIISSPSLGSLITSPRAEAFAAAIEGILRSSDAGRGMGRAGRASLLGRMDSDTVGAQWRDLYTTLTRGRRKRP